jgi:PIN domain nuclease of toxin-antitoxin system
VVVWLYAGKIDNLSEKTKTLIDKNELFISPIVRLELQYLYEIQRITVEANDIILNLSDLIGLQICNKNFNTIINGAFKLSWTRDPFDRIIVANASVNQNILVTKDQNILKNYQKAIG